MRNLISTLILLASVFVFINCSSDSTEGIETTEVIETTEKDEKIVETGTSKNLLKHSVLNEEVDDNIAKTQVAVDILLQDKIISEEGIRNLLNELYDQIKNRTGFRYHDHPTAIYIYAYSSREKADSGMGQWVGMLSKNHDDTKPQIRISETQLRAVNIIAEEKFEFKEEERQKIWKKIAKIELKAQGGADHKYPINHPDATEEDMEKNAQLNYKLQEKYQKELAKEYKTTVAILDSISNEAIEKGWAIPGL